MSGSSTGIAIVAITGGTWLAYSALKGQSLADALTGEGGAALDPAGAHITIPQSTEPTGGPPLATGLGGAGASSMEAEMNRMIGLSLPYRWGGGHGAKPSPNGPWDCSGAVSQVTDFLGLLPGHRPMTSTGFMTWGEAGEGDTFTVYANPTHVFIHMNTGTYSGQDWGTTSRLPSQGGSLKWQQHTKIGFVARRPKS